MSNMQLLQNVLEFLSKLPEGYLARIYAQKIYDCDGDVTVIVIANSEKDFKSYEEALAINPEDSK